MRKAMLVTALLLSSAVAAVAQPRDYYPTQPAPRHYPDYPGDEIDNYPDRDRYQRYDGSRWQRDYRARWVTLASAFPATTHRQFIKAHGQVFDRIRVESVHGAPMIVQVGVQYTNGTTQVVKMNTRLAYGSGEVIRLNRAPVQRIVVYTDPRYRGAYALYGGHGRRGGQPGV